MTGLDRYISLTAKPRKAPRAKRAQPEKVLQRSVMKALNQAFPETWFFCVNNTYSSAIEGARMKALGVKAGIPDIGVFPCAGGVVGWIELKAGTITESSFSAEQKKFRQACQAHGTPWVAANSIDAAMDAVMKMKGLRL